LLSEPFVYRTMTARRQTETVEPKEMNVRFCLLMIQSRHSTFVKIP
jgi:hypothetical protein